MINRNKKAAADIWVLTILMLLLLTASIVLIIRNKSSADKQSLNNLGPNALSSQKIELENKIQQKLIEITPQVYQDILSKHEADSETPDQIITKEFNSELIQKINPEFNKVEITIGEENIIFDNKNINITTPETKFKALQFTPDGKETFRGVYTTPLKIQLSLKELDIPPASIQYFKNIYQNCIEDSKEPESCISSNIPEFFSSLLLEPITKEKTEVSLILESKRKYVIDESIKTIKLKILVGTVSK